MNTQNAHALRIEHAKFALALPQSTSSWGDRLLIGVTLDHGHPPCSLTEGTRFDSADRLLQKACSERAIGLIDGWLQVAGRKECTPERYVRDWRQVLLSPTPIGCAPDLLGFHPIAVFEYDVRAEPLARSHRSDEPAGGLRRLLDRHPGRPLPGAADPNRRLIWVDLTQPDGPFDAMWLSIFLRPARECPFGMSESIEVPTAECVATQAWTPSIQSEQTLHHDPRPEAAAFEVALDTAA